MKNNILGDRIRAEREKRKMTLAQAAQQLGIKHSTLHGYESGYREPRPAMLSKIASLYDIPVDYLLGNDTKEPNNINSEKVKQELLDDIDRLTMEQLLRKYALIPEGFTLTPEEAKFAFETIMALRKMNNTSQHD